MINIEMVEHPARKPGSNYVNIIVENLMVMNNTSCIPIVIFASQNISL
jgi:hypothetical protein